jgi:glycerophosphoryl diester phosphodiesterase
MIDVIAHRGLRHEKPENSLDAVSAALQLEGISGVEFDVELTRDGKAMVLHQETVVPNAEFTALEPAPRNYTSRDWVIERRASEIALLDAGSWMSAEFVQVKVPTLREVLELPWRNTVAYVELKDATYWGSERELARPARVIEAVLTDLVGFRGALNVISFNPEILRILHTRASHIPTTLALWTTDWQGYPAEALDEARRCGASTVSLPYQMVLHDPDWVARARYRGIKIHAYPVSPARGEPDFDRWISETQVEIWHKLQRIGVDAILSDFARETLQALEAAADQTSDR